MFETLASLAGNVFSGLLGKSANDKALAQTNQMNERNIQLQREFAQNGIRWKAEDARAAGLHPLFAMGAPTTSFSPVVGDIRPDMSMANMAKDMGQDLSRAIHATRTNDERAGAFNETVRQLSTEKLGLENELLRAQIGKIRAQTGPAMPAPGSTYVLDGQGDTARVSPWETGAQPWSVIGAQKRPGAKQQVQAGPIWESNPYLSNADDVEQRHGELADAAWGVVSIPGDIAWNVYRNWNSPTHKKINEWVRKNWRDLIPNPFATRPAY